MIKRVLITVILIISSVEVVISQCDGPCSDGNPTITGDITCWVNGTCCNESRCWTNGTYYPNGMSCWGNGTCCANDTCWSNAVCFPDDDICCSNNTCWKIATCYNNATCCAGLHCWNEESYQQSRFVRNSSEVWGEQQRGIGLSPKKMSSSSKKRSSAGTKAS